MPIIRKHKIQDGYYILSFQLNKRQFIIHTQTKIRKVAEDIRNQIKPNLILYTRKIQGIFFVTLHRWPNNGRRTKDPIHLILRVERDKRNNLSDHNKKASF